MRRKKLVNGWNILGHGFHTSSVSYVKYLWLLVFESGSQKCLCTVIGQHGLQQVLLSAVLSVRHRSPCRQLFVHSYWSARSSAGVVICCVICEAQIPLSSVVECKPDIFHTQYWVYSMLHILNWKNCHGFWNILSPYLYWKQSPLWILFKSVYRFLFVIIYVSLLYFMNLYFVLLIHPFSLIVVLCYISYSFLAHCFPRLSAPFIRYSRP